MKKIISKQIILNRVKELLKQLMIMFLQNVFKFQIIMI